MGHITRERVKDASLIWHMLINDCIYRQQVSMDSVQKTNVVFYHKERINLYENRRRRG